MMTNALRDEVAALLVQRPDLTRHGFGAPDWPRSPSAPDYEEKKNAYGQYVKSSHEALLLDFVLEEIAAARRWLSQWPKLKHPNRRGSSYGLKHVAERAENCYISNGSFIVAAMLEGFDCLEDGPNALINIPAKSWKKKARQKTVWP